MTPSEEILSAYLDDELGAQERADVERRLASDAHWRETLEKLQEVRAWVQDLPAVTPSRPKSIVQMLAEQKPDQNDSSVRLGDNANISAAPSSWKWMMSLAATSLLLVGTTLWWVSGVGQPIAFGPTLENAAPEAPIPAIRSEGASIQSKSPKTSSPIASVASASTTDGQAEGGVASLVEETTQRKMNAADYADGQSAESLPEGELLRDSPAPKSMAAQDAPAPLSTGAAPTDPTAAQPLKSDGDGSIPFPTMNAETPPGSIAGSDGELGSPIGRGGLEGNLGFGGAGGIGAALGGGMGGGAPAPAPLENLPGASAPMDPVASSRGRSPTMKDAPSLPAPSMPAPSPAVGNAALVDDAQGAVEMVDPKRIESNSDRFASGMELPARPLSRYLTEKNKPTVNSMYFLARDPTFAVDEPESGTASDDNSIPNELMMRKEDRGAKAGQPSLQRNRNSTESAPAGDAAEVASGASATSYRFVTDQVIHLTVPTEVFADIEESISKGELKVVPASPETDSKPGAANSNIDDSERNAESAVNESTLWLLELSPLNYEALRKRWSEKGFDVTEILDDRRLNLVREYVTADASDQSGATDAPSPPDTSADPTSRSDDANPTNKPAVQADFIFILLQGR